MRVPLVVALPSLFFFATCPAQALPGAAGDRARGDRDRSDLESSPPWPVTTPPEPPTPSAEVVDWALRVGFVRVHVDGDRTMALSLDDPDLGHGHVCTAPRAPVPGASPQLDPVPRHVRA